MHSGNAIATSAAVAATFGSSFFMMPHAASGQVAVGGVPYAGIHDEDVYTVQSILKKLGQYPEVMRTGYSDDAAETAVKQPQLLSGLTVKAETGNRPKKNSASYRRTALISIGSRGSHVVDLQQYLYRIGYYHGKIDGIFGSRTRQAVILLQRKTEILVDGIVGPQTWKSIENQHVFQKKTSDADSGTEKKQNRILLKKNETQQTAYKPAVKKGRKQAVKVKEFYVSSTAYTAYCSGCSGTTATGINLRSNSSAKVVAVDPAIIPLGTKLFVEGYGYAVAGDTGGAIKGRKIDVFFKDNATALQWGRRTVKVRIVE